MNLMEAKNILENAGYIVEGVEDGDISGYDRDKILSGKNTRWTRKNVDVGEINKKNRKKNLKQSSSYSERAMQSVTTEFGKEKHVYDEDDMRRDKQANVLMNLRIYRMLKKLLNRKYKFDVDDKEISIFNDQYIFRIRSAGTGYRVYRFNTRDVLDRKTARCSSLKEVKEFIMIVERKINHL